jgi:hypothetical protein
MLDALITTKNSRQVAYAIGAIIRIRTNCGTGNLVYVTDDLYLGVKLDGETRIDEYHSAACQAVRS